jgi:hypothetical protein
MYGQPEFCSLEMLSGVTRPPVECWRESKAGLDAIAGAAGRSGPGASLGMQLAGGAAGSTGDLVVAATHDVKVHGANITAGGDAQIAAGHDITVDAVESYTSQSVTKNADNFVHADTTLNQTSGVNAGGSLAMQSGNDMTFRGASFGARDGHIANTPANRALLTDVANDPKTALGVDQFGNTWSGKTLPDGTQVWVQTRNGQVWNAGVNQIPREFNSTTGLAAPTRPGWK